jgi:hypothetical protein
MRASVAGLYLLVGCGLSFTSPAPAQKEEPLVNQVRDAIQSGIQFLRDVERGTGRWETGGDAVQAPGGTTSLAMLALLNSGIKPNDPMIERGLGYLRTVEPERTYVVGLQTMVFAAAGRPEDKERIQRNVDWLVQAAIKPNATFVGWNYGRFGAGDNSNTQYALLGLHDGRQAGAKVDPQVWKTIRDYYVRTQSREGGWGYALQEANGPTLTMTTAGLCGLLIAGMELNDRREVIRADGSALHCGRYAENEPITRAHAWIGRRDRKQLFQDRKATFYNLYGIERAGRLTGLRFLGNYDWYREGCGHIVEVQNKAEGSWAPGGLDTNKVIATSFALLFLSKGRTPILISKLVHGPGEDWNNDRHDARNLVGYASKELFNGAPLAWQIFDTKRGIVANNRDERLRLAADLMQSPIAYFNGHRAPIFTEAEEEVLKEYIEQGGFIFAEACCGFKEFDQGFRALMTKLFPDNPIKPLPPEHPIWRAHALVKPGEFGLEGIEMGCKTVVVYAPQDLSCLWEANTYDAGKGQLAFRLGGNIIAYATGMELPKPRLTPVEIVRDDPSGPPIPRGYLKIAQLRHDGDWQPAPRAMRNLLANLQEKSRLMVALKTEAIHPAQQGVLDFKFLYMHGRNGFSYDKGDLPAGDDSAMAHLRANLQTGGILLADACCGKKAFDTSFRALMTRLFPDKRLEPIPLDDVLYGKELNGVGIATVRCRRERADGAPDNEFREVAPFLEGIKLNGRWAVIYSKYDIGCALEKHQSSDCLGHDHASALRLGSAVVLYALKR